MPQVPFTHCPDCGYDLHGLPTRHRCPECAFEYDEYTLVLKPKSPTLLLASAIATNAVLIIQMVMPQFIDRKLWHTRTWFGFAAFSSFVLVGAWAIWRIVKNYRQARLGLYIALAPAGIRARTMTGSVHISWPEITHVRRRMDGSIDVACSTPDARKRCSQITFGDEGTLNIISFPKESREFCDLAQAALERHRAAALTVVQM